MESNYTDQQADANDSLIQLRRLAMLYHSRGLVTEAQEIYRLIVQIEDARVERDKSRRTSTED